MYVVPATIISVTTPTIVIEGHTTSISCLVGGDPTPQVVWKFEDEELIFSDRIVVSNGNQTVTFTSAMASDDGFYRCQATNSIRSVTAQIKLTVHGQLHH